MITAVPARQNAATTSMSTHDEGGHISMSKALGVFIITIAFLAVSVWFTNLFVKLRLW